MEGVKVSFFNAGHRVMRLIRRQRDFLSAFTPNNEATGRKDDASSDHRSRGNFRTGR